MKAVLQKKAVVCLENITATSDVRFYMVNSWTGRSFNSVLNVLNFSQDTFETLEWYVGIYQGDTSLRNKPPEFFGRKLLLQLN